MRKPERVTQQKESEQDASLEKCNTESQENKNTGKESSSTSSSVQAVPDNTLESHDSVDNTIENVVKTEVVTDDHVESTSPLDKATDITQNTDNLGIADGAKKPLSSIIRRKKRSFGDKRETSQRKAKSDACDRLSGKFQEKVDDDDYEPGIKISRASLGAKRKTYKLRRAGTFEGPDDKIERTVARSFIVSKDILSKLGSKLGYQNSSPTAVEKSPIITSVYSNYQNPHEKSSTPVITNIRSLLPQNRANRPVTNTFKTSVGSQRPFANSIKPLLSTTSTQTAAGSFGRSHKFLHIIDSDRKLCIFSGIPSFDVLEKITDTTLKMVMSQAMRSEIQPTMREWIIVTCTKFMLNISIEALAVMFELDEDECSRIVEKTSLFLRKTLSLPDGQKFVWSLPTDVLNGIADFSDGAVNIG
ncbi:Zinc finger protein CONSTANS-LIKE 12 [Frankliniella fusca]|uniref:Zinc finger protein CONSTANS-LIKE 12 n=1 Tax=Frankliniella fusca TaxID=407009 RepID=A0AAE1GXD6_9NEOP|nr:Zinc finger protein CONSTANS-LIKE 12 [Frankliniella fusca]